MITAGPWPVRTTELADDPFAIHHKFNSHYDPAVMRYRLSGSIPDLSDAFQLVLELTELLKINRDLIDGLRIGKFLLPDRSSELLNSLLKFPYSSVNKVCLIDRPYWFWYDQNMIADERKEVRR